MLISIFAIQNTRTETLKTTIAEKKEEQVTFRAKIKDYEHNLADSKGYRERQLKEAKENMAKTKAQSDKSRKEWDKHEQDAEILKLEIEELHKSIDQAKEEIQECENKVQELQQKVFVQFYFIFSSLSRGRKCRKSEKIEFYH